MDRLNGACCYSLLTPLLAGLAPLPWIYLGELDDYSPNTQWWDSSHQIRISSSENKNNHNVSYFLGLHDLLALKLTKPIWTKNFPTLST